MRKLRKRVMSLPTALFSCSRRTLSGILIACFHFMIIRGLIDLVYFNFMVPEDETPTLRHYIHARSSWMSRKHHLLSQVSNGSNLTIFRIEDSAQVMEKMSAQKPLPSQTANSAKPFSRYGLHIPIAEPQDFAEIGPNASYCGNDDTFQYGFDFLKGDLKMGSFNLSPGSAYACCRQCETMQLCTHWTWYENFCWLKNAPTAVKPKAGVIAGRVAVNQWVQRRIILPVKRRPYNCSYDAEDRPFFEPSPENASSTSPAPPRIKRYIVINEPRTGSSWLQEVSQMHPGIKVQFELDMEKGDAALNCRQCSRPTVPNSKYAARLPKKLHPPLACGMTIFGGNNKFSDVSELANRQGAMLVILLRVNHVAHAISAYRHFNKPKPTVVKAIAAQLASGKGLDNATRTVLNAAGLVIDHETGELLVPWNSQQLRQNVEELRQSYGRLTRYPAQTSRPAHFIFYEDLKRHPNLVWRRLQKVLELPVVELQNISNLEKKSTSRPSLLYLTNFSTIQEDLRNSSWHEMVEDMEYDDTVDVGVNFLKICRRNPESEISWRLHYCRNGTVYAWEEEA